MQFHGRAYSVWRQVTFFTRRNVRPFHFSETEFVPVKPARSVAELPDMGGGVEFVAHAGGRVRVSTLERTMVDVLDTPALGGGWEEIWRSLEMVEFFDLDAVISYTLSLRTALTAARVGFFLEEHRDALFVEDRHLEVLESHSPRQARYLDQSRESGRLSYTSALGRPAILEVDINFMLRVPLWSPVKRDSRVFIQDQARAITVLDEHELAAGKLARTARSRGEP